MIILTVQTTPTHRTMQASAETWQAVIQALRQAQLAGLATTVANLTAGQVGNAVRVTLPLREARRILDMMS